MTLIKITQSKWENAKLAALALMLGLVGVPYLSNFLGWQVASGTVLARERAAIVEQLASICHAQARREVGDEASWIASPEVIWRRNGPSCQEGPQRTRT
jgi:hypothetical protein